MAFCKKCGAYIPIDETACPACGYDPDEEARKAREAEEAARREKEEAARRAEEEERRKQQAANWAAQERAREEARRRAQQQQQQSRPGGSYGASQSQYTSHRTGQSGAAQSQYASQRKETWVPPWSQTETNAQSAQSSQARTDDYSQMREKARESVENQKLSVLSYIWPLALIPLILRGKDDFARYHANQGLVLLIAEGIASAGLSILGLESLGFLVGIAGLAGTIKGIGNVLRGKKEPLPFIGGIDLLK